MFSETNASPTVEHQKVKIPQRFLCKISNEIMSDPVIAPDGFTYEREVIVKALKANPSSPMTREPIEVSKLTLIPNRDLKSDIQEFLQQHPGLYATDVYLSQATKDELVAAIRQGDQKKVAGLLQDERLLVQPLGESQLTALHVACETTHLDIILLLAQKLLEKNQLKQVLNSIDLKAWQATGLFALCSEMIQAKDNEKFFKLMQGELGQVLNVNSANEKNQTLMHIALKVDNPAMIKALINFGFKNWRALEQGGKSCLHCAIESRSLVQLKLALENDVSANILDDEKRPPLFYALEAGWEDGALHLLAQGAKVNYSDRQGRQIMHQLAQRPVSLELYQAIMEKKPDLTVADQKGACPIHLAAAAGNLAFLEAIAKTDPGSLTVADQEGNQPAHYAAKAGQEAFFNQLMQLNVKIDTPNKQNQTPYQLAKQAGAEGIVHLLDTQGKAKGKFFAALKKGDLARAKFMLKQYPKVLFQSDSEAEKSAYLVACENGGTKMIAFLQEALGGQLLGALAQIKPQHLTARVVGKTLKAAMARLDTAVAQWCLSQRADLLPRKLPDTLNHQIVRQNAYEFELLSALVGGAPPAPNKVYLSLKIKATASGDKERGHYRITMTSLRCLFRNSDGVVLSHTIHESSGATLAYPANAWAKIINAVQQNNLAPLYESPSDWQILQDFMKQKHNIHVSIGRYLAVGMATTGHIVALSSQGMSGNQQASSNSQTYAIQLWQREKGTCTASFPVQLTLRDNIRKVAVTAQGQVIFPGSTAATLQILDTQTGNCISLDTKSAAEHQITNFAITATGSIITLSFYKRLDEWDSKTCKLLRQIDNQATQFVLMGPENRIVLVRSYNNNGNAQFWDSQTGSFSPAPFQTNALGKIIAATPKGHLVSCGDDGNNFIKWDGKTGQKLGSFNTDLCRFDANLRIKQISALSEVLILAVLSDNTHKLLDSENGQCLFTFPAQTVMAVKTLEGNLVAVEGGQITFWRTKNLQQKLRNAAKFSLLASAPFKDTAQAQEFLKLFQISDPLETDFRGDTLLHYAARAGNRSLLEFLLGKGDLVELPSKSCAPVFFAGEAFCPSTPLHYAIVGDRPECVRYLLEKGADLRQADKQGKCPLQLAAACGHQGCVQVLLEHGAAPDFGTPHPKALALAGGHHATAAVLEPYYQLLEVVQKKLSRLEQKQKKLKGLKTFFTAELQQQDKKLQETTRKITEEVEALKEKSQPAQQRSPRFFAGAVPDPGAQAIVQNQQETQAVSGTSARPKLGGT